MSAPWIVPMEMLSQTKEIEKLKQENAALSEVENSLQREIKRLEGRLVEQRRNLGEEHDKTCAELKRVQSNASWELNDYAKTVERLNKKVWELEAERDSLRERLAQWEASSLNSKKIDADITGRQWMIEQQAGEDATDEQES